MELKATDLRVGNWLRFDNMISEPYNYQVSPRMFRQMGYDVSENLDLKINNYHKPIPITEEILLKCGFEKHQKYDYTYLSTFFIIEFEVETQMYIFRKRINNYESIFLCEFTFLHQLQNLIFALTKTELTIKL